MIFTSLKRNPSFVSIWKTFPLDPDKYAMNDQFHIFLFTLPQQTLYHSNFQDPMESFYGKHADKRKLTRQRWNYGKDEWVRGIQLIDQRRNSELMMKAKKLKSLPYCYLPLIYLSKI